MLIARLENDQIAEYPLTTGDVKERFPGASFPIPFEPPNGYVFVKSVDPPGHEYYQTLEETTPKFDDGQWVQDWKIIDIPEEALAIQTEYTKANVRNIRNLLLAETDWTQGRDISDSVSDLWAPYRQALRDITEQPGFPFHVSWPEKPGQ